MSPEQPEPQEDTTPTFFLLSGNQHAGATLEIAIQHHGFSSNEAAAITVIVDAPRGFALAKLIQKSDIASKAVVITWQTCPEYLEDLWDYGPAVLLRLVGNDLIQQLPQAIIRATTGDRYRTPNNDTPVLTIAQRQVLRYAACGMADTEIGERLGLSAYTVRNRVSDILRKLNLKNRTQLALYYWGISPILDAYYSKNPL